MSKIIQVMTTTTILIVVTFVLCHCAQSLQPFPGSADEVKSLPGLNFKPKFRHYSGYLESINRSQLHYWFFESQNNSLADPVVLWLNGGPGCSSLLGALTEQGPIRVDKNGQLRQNQYAWNLRTNIIFLESPAGVGFSYNLNNNYTTGDRETAIANYQAIKSFFIKFPHLQQNGFYIAGESYGGIYVPTLSEHVLNGKYPVNFKGFAVGNAYLDETMLGNSLMHFAYYHGLYDSVLWNRLLINCCDNVSNPINCDFVNNKSFKCKEALFDATYKIFQPQLNPYNIYQSCSNNSNSTTLLSSTSQKNSLYPEQVEMKYVKKYLLKQENVLPNPPCTNYDYLDDWINQESVRKALHIRPESGYWLPCSVNVSYLREYKSMLKLVRYLLKSGLKGLIYNGDVDAMCNFLGDEWFADALGFKQIRDYTPWLYDGQVAGYVKVYEKFAFTTIRGSGHMVPTDRPGPALKMFYKFLDSN